MNTFKLMISSPDGNIFEGEIIKFDVRGAMGDLAVMAGHIPFVTTVAKGPCTIETLDGDIKKATCEGGLLTVGKDSTTFFSGSFKFED